jgi:hypothetical protein
VRLFFSIGEINYESGNISWALIRVGMQKL